MTEEEQEVRWTDQEKINEFGCLNNRLIEIRLDLTQINEDNEKLNDSISEMSLLIDGNYMILMGEAFIEGSEDFITEYCEKKIEVCLFVCFLFFVCFFLLFLISQFFNF